MVGSITITEPPVKTSVSEQKMLFPSIVRAGLFAIIVIVCPPVGYLRPLIHTKEVTVAECRAEEVGPQTHPLGYWGRTLKEWSLG